MNTGTTERGLYRSVEMEDLQRWASSPLWDNESTQGAYIHPLLIGRLRAQLAGWHLAIGNPSNETYRLGRYVCATSPQSHIGPYRHAIDFLVPDGTPVLAASDGVVLEVQEHSTQYGPTSEYRDLLNYLTVRHENGECSQYCHLAPQSVTQSGVIVGTRVRRGQQIAIVGKTGWTDRDHLHFIVFRGAHNESPFPFKSLRIKFV